MLRSVSSRCVERERGREKEKEREEGKESQAETPRHYIAHLPLPPFNQQGDAKALFRRALAYEREGETEKAIADLEEALSSRSFKSLKQVEKALQRISGEDRVSSSSTSSPPAAAAKTTAPSEKTATDTWASKEATSSRWKT